MERKGNGLFEEASRNVSLYSKFLQKGDARGTKALRGGEKNFLEF